MENKAKFDSIKKESVRNIFDAISRKQQISRAEIADITGLSLMTVGKVADAFLERGIIVQIKENRVLAGRKAGLVSLNREQFSVILDLTSNRFAMSVIDCMLDVSDKMEYEYNQNFYFEENLYIFLKNVKIYMLRHLNMTYCMGIGVSVPGAYDKDADCVRGIRMPELRNVKIRNLIEDVLKEKVSVIGEDIVYAAISNTVRISDFRRKTIFYLYLGDSICGTIVCDGKPLFSTGAGNLGQTISRSGKTLEERMAGREITAEQLTELGIALYNAIWIVNPDVIVIENKRLLQDDDLAEHLELAFQKMFEKKSHITPQIVISDTDIRHANLGIALEIRGSWMERITRS